MSFLFQVSIFIWWGMRQNLHKLVNNVLNNDYRRNRIIYDDCNSREKEAMALPQAQFQISFTKGDENVLKRVC